MIIIKKIKVCHGTVKNIVRKSSLRALRASRMYRKDDSRTFTRERVKKRVVDDFRGKRQKL